MRVPKFLTPRRKYEVDESKRLVKFGRSHLGLVSRAGSRLLALARYAEAFAYPQGRWLIAHWWSVRLILARQARKLVLFFQRGRVPQDREISRLESMKAIEFQGHHPSGGLLHKVRMSLGDYSKSSFKPFLYAIMVAFFFAGIASFVSGLIFLGVFLWAVLAFAVALLWAGRSHSYSWRFP